ncbi:amino acid permease [Fusarium pseudocircinatum]|uniref:Amino acid permease n=1 Tax=Fusarium pseudocircinatum TaxID=56676 RepID=A0A8H5P3D7_9HYPO|nr:amino acid permease [Fusarium pseudocircinatum]
MTSIANHTGTKDVPSSVPEEEKRVNVLEKTQSYTDQPAESYAIREDNLSRVLSARQVQMIAIGGTIGTGLFLGSGKALANSGPASMLIAYLVVGAIVFVTMLSLGEMTALIPVAGCFCTFTSFVDDALGFAMTWNYWFNNAVTVASDMVALQLLLAYWTNNFPGWALSLIVWVVLIGLNIITTKAYGETEYWLSLLKVITITVSEPWLVSNSTRDNRYNQIFMILGIVVNCGANTDHTYIGGKNWHVGDAPFVGGIGGFASVFVTASFSYGGTESIGITAGETKNPAKNLPQVVKNVFWRILIFYILSVLLIGLNVPYNYPGLNTKNVNTSPFTIVFQQVGAKAAGSFMNAVILTSVISAGNHALFAGTRLVYTMSCSGHAPKCFGRLNKRKVPWVAVLITSSISALCFGASKIGAGELWSWLQNIVGVSNQLAWIAINLTSIRFRSALKAQGKTEYLSYRNPTYPWGPWTCVFLCSSIILVQGWTAFSPSFKVVDFFSLYIELPIMAVMYVAWKLFKKTKIPALKDIDVETDRYVPLPEEFTSEGVQGKLKRYLGWIL